MKKVILFLASCLLVFAAGAKTVSVSNSDLEWEENTSGEMEARIVIGDIGCSDVTLNFTGGNASKVPCYRVAIIDNGDPDYDYWHELSDWNDILEVNSSGNGSTTISLTACGQTNRVIAFFIQLDKNPNIPQYTVSVQSNYSYWGTVTGGGTYDKGELVKITATPYEGYVFKEWSDGNTDNPRYLTVSSDINLTAYFEQPDFQYEINPDGRTVTLTKARYGIEVANIPSSVTINGNTYTVIAIGYNVFNNSRLTSVSIPSTVTSIDDQAFYACESLTSITIPNSVTSIGEDAFARCGLTSIEIPNGVISIGEDAFCECYSATSLTIPSSVTSIGRTAFAFCPLTSITVDAGNTTYDSRNNCNAIIETKTNRLIVGCKNTVIPNTVTFIGVESFAGSSSTSITIPNNVTSIGKGAFEYCEQLTSIIIPSSVTSISDGMFLYCEQLSSVIIPNNVTSIGVRAFLGCEKLSSIIIPSSVTSVGGGAFEECSNLTSITCLAKTPPVFSAVYEYEDGDVEVFSSFCDEGAYITVYVPSESVSAYKSAPVWKTLNIQPIPGENYTITLSVNNNSYGTVIGGGEYIEGTSVTIAAVASSGYEFEKWNDGNTQNPRTITVTGNASYTAYFKASQTQSEETYTISLLSGNNSQGSVVGSGEYKKGQTATLVAVASSGYEFDQWNDGNTQNPRTITVSGNATYIANFKVVQSSSGNKYTVSLFSNNNSYGTVIGGGEYAEGSSAILVAMPTSGYEFEQWNDGNTENPRTITVTENVGFIANFKAISTQTNYYTITLSSNNDEFGSVMGDGEYKEGEKVSLIAIPAMGYRFVQWSDGNSQNPREITVSSNASYAATFEQTSSGELDYTVTAIPASNDQGTVVGGGIYGPLSTVTLAVVPATGYKFVQWNDGNTDNPRVVIVMGDCFYVATFEKISTDISEVENAMNVAIINRQIVVNGEAPAFVYTIMGQKIANQNLKLGVYFVVVDGETVKVSVQ